MLTKKYRIDKYRETTVRCSNKLKNDTELKKHTLHIAFLFLHITKNNSSRIERNTKKQIRYCRLIPAPIIVFNSKFVACIILLLFFNACCVRGLFEGILYSNKYGNHLTRLCIILFCKIISIFETMFDNLVYLVTLGTCKLPDKILRLLYIIT